MVLTAQSTTDEDSQNRQLVVNKRFSKAVSAVPRARFQRARPNVPSSKRTDSNSAQPRTQKPPLSVENIKLEPSEPENCTNRLQKCTVEDENLESKVLKCSDVSPATNSNSSNSEDAAELSLSSAISKDRPSLRRNRDAPIEIPLEIENCDTSDIVRTVNIVTQPSSNEISQPDKKVHNEVLVAISKSCEIFDASPQKTVAAKCRASNDTINIAKNLTCADIHKNYDASDFVSQKKNCTEINAKSSDVVAPSASSDVNEKLSDAVAQNSSCGDINVNYPVSSDVIAQYNCEGASKYDRTSSDISTKSCVVAPVAVLQACAETKDKSDDTIDVAAQNGINAVLNKESCDASNVALQTETSGLNKELNSSATSCVMEERNDASTSVASTVIDRASKYPHLTSILSKKRTEPKKDVQHKRRRKYRKGDIAPERSKMTMADLIYWNPTTSDFGMKKTSIADEEPVRIDVDIPAMETPEIEELQVEDDVCDSVPKLVISEDGTINIDQVSLVVSRKTLPEPPINQVVRNEETTYSSFRKRPLSKHWTTKDTFIFYKALSLVGTDFGLMESLLPHRTRRELKMKFKREEKYNIDLINRAMYESHLTFDAQTLEEQIQSLSSINDNFDRDSTQENDQPLVNGNKSTKRKRKASSKKTVSDDSGTLTPDKDADHKVLSKSIKEKKKKKKKLSESDINTDDGEMGEPIVNEENGLQKKKVSNKRKRKTKELSESPTNAENADEEEAATEGLIKRDSNKRIRKEKKLPDCYISLEDVDLEVLIDQENIDGDNSRTSSLENYYRQDNQRDSSSTPSDELPSDTICEESTNIEILCIEDADVEMPSSLEYGKTIVVMNNDMCPKNSEDVMPEVEDENVRNGLTTCIKDVRDNYAKTYQKSVDKKISNNGDIACLKKAKVKRISTSTGRKTARGMKKGLISNFLEAVPTYETSQTCVNQVSNSAESEIQILSNVMANEVVTSVEPSIKQKRKIKDSSKNLKQAAISETLRQISKQKNSAMSVQPSFLNYTPTEVQLQFTPKSNLRTYSKSPMKTPQHSLLTSLQTPMLTPEQSSSLLTTLNMSNNQTVTIPLTPETNSIASPVMVFAKSPNTENLFHLFMYNTPTV